MPGQDLLFRFTVVRAAILAGALLTICACGAAPGTGVVRNSDFAVVTGQPPLPSHWTTPGGGQWRWLAQGGPEGRPCMQYEAGPALVGPLLQECDFCEPQAPYELRAVVRATGGLSPVLVIWDRQDRKQPLATLACQAGAAWTVQKVAFKTVAADINIEVYADVAHREGRAARAGQVGVAQVTIARAGAALPRQTLPDLGENLALHRTYTLAPPGNYSYCTDPDDKTQLTDGVYTEGYFWTQKTTVGWQGQTPIITLDLGQDVPIKGVTYNTAAGIAGGYWPAQILVFASPDSQSWHEVGDLVKLHRQHTPLPLYGEYQVHRLWTDQLRTHGRYLALWVEPTGACTFADEIEVYRGEDAWLQQPYAGAAVASISEAIRQRATDGVIQAQLRRDLATVQAGLAALPAALRPALAQRAAQLAAAIEAMAPVPMEGFRAVLPMTDLERDIFRLQAAVWRAAGQPPLRLWTKHRWDMLEPAEEPAGATPPLLEVHAMNNEVRAAVLNLTNAADREEEVRVRVTGLPGGDDPSYVQVYEVLTVGTRRFVAVSAALPEARRAGPDVLVTVPAGMTRQVWFSFHPTSLAAGTHAGKVVVTPSSGRALSAPLRLTIYPLRLPDQLTLCVGGWEYTNADRQYGVTPENRQALTSYLREHCVNGPWATGQAFPFGEYDAAGNLVKEPDTANFDNWVKLWPGAKMYMGAPSFRPEFAGAKLGTEQFDLRVGNWARFWVRHMRALGLSPGQLGWAIFDEPSTKEKYDFVTAYARAIKRAAPELTIWEDPQPQEDKDCLEMFASVDILCPNRTNFLAREDWYREMFRSQGRQGRVLWFYSCSNPARSFDPFSYYLLQEWQCFQEGATGSCFWAFGDNARVSCWNEFAAEGMSPGPYCPLYLDDTSVTGAKYMEAIREGAQDYEYLTMLRNRTAELARRGVPAAKLAAARQLLVSGPERVLALEKGPNYRWDETKDRGVQDRVRVEILRALTELAKL